MSKSRRVRRHKESLKKIDNLIATHLTISPRVRRHKESLKKIDNLIATHPTISPRVRRHKESLKKIDNLIATHPTISHCQLSTAIYWNCYRNTLQTSDRDMVQAPQKTITLEEFLQLPETKPAREYINGVILQKPMPQGKHSTIQGELITTVNAVGKPQRIAWAFPELRCTFGGRSIVPDVAIFVWNRIPLDADGEIANTFNAHPDWTIEILSPAQSQTKVTNNILHCLNAGCQMGWLLDPDEKNILAYPARQQPISLQEPTDILPVPEFMGEMQLTLGEVFGWLKPGFSTEPKIVESSNIKSGSI